MNGNSGIPEEKQGEDGQEQQAMERGPDGGSEQAEPGDGRLHEELAEELDRLIERVRAATPEYSPPPFSPRGLVQLIERNLERFSPELRLGVLERLRSAIGNDLFDVDTWKGIWYMVNYSLEYQSDLLKRRLTGEYETDEWGYDPEMLQAAKPFFDFLYNRYWRVETTGIENIPEEGRALLVVNHSGQLPWDGSMVATAVYNEHPAQRLVRNLYGDWFTTLPFVSVVFSRLGQVLANEQNGIRLLEQEQLVAVYPEGYKGVGKLFKDRYKLERFGRGGFVRMALQTGAPVIPVAVVGAEETYISLAKSPALANLTGFPYFPISPTFPWLGPLGFVPLPTKWTIDFGEPITFEGFDLDQANHLVANTQLSDQVRNVIQEMIYQRLAERKSIFFG